MREKGEQVEKYEERLAQGMKKPGNPVMVSQVMWKSTTCH